MLYLSTLLTYASLMRVCAHFGLRKSRVSCTVSSKEMYRWSQYYAITAPQTYRLREDPRTTSCGHEIIICISIEPFLRNVNYYSARSRDLVNRFTDFQNKPSDFDGALALRREFL